MKCLVPLLTLSLTMSAQDLMAQNYRAEQTSDHGVPVVRLSDAAKGDIRGIHRAFSYRQ